MKNRFPTHNSIPAANNYQKKILRLKLQDFRYRGGD